ncbi:N-acetylglucosamine-6-phosphate deacetylase [Sphingobacterium phlebotomi]|uniref:N-acetylglucosamine-6-phosphate deacetylase n=1 Tax=Sphingobacterium phlebotomi TaxID=2605433 RepID=A0A5D4HBY0_9SPHI|nr:N-acetylglucosamine-6-phosphate deacetylase [Sphingobacterium phlebotomi]TYR38074.1 N-acetylglucosamine-6-phosphate deacetylase [Sphingobacterium phlebotomi]
MSKIKIVNAKIITPDRIMDNGILLVQDGVISGIREEDEEGWNGEVLDAEGAYVSPGFIDIHVHGGGGADFMDNDVDAFLHIAETHARFGTTGMLPTTLTSDQASLLETFRVYEKTIGIHHDGARFYGLHLEGPYFAMNQRGAQDPRFIRNPDPAEYEPILKQYKHLIARWSAAPELPGALDFGRRVQEEGILVALAHTDAVYEDILQGLDCGYRLATHLYSGMSGMTRKNAHRYAGAIESCLLLDEIDVEIIADGVHLPEPFLKLICKIKHKDKIILITDAMRAAGTADTVSVLGGKTHGLDVIVEGGVAKLPDRTSFAGSVATADRLIRVMVYEAGVALTDAVQMMTSNPARIIGVDHHVGSIELGKDADLVIFDDNIHIKKTMIKGRVVYES